MVLHDSYSWKGLDIVPTTAANVAVDSIQPLGTLSIQTIARIFLSDENPLVIERADNKRVPRRILEFRVYYVIAHCRCWIPAVLDYKRFLIEGALDGKDARAFAM